MTEIEWMPYSFWSWLIVLAFALLYFVVPILLVRPGAQLSRRGFAIRIVASLIALKGIDSIVQFLSLPPSPSIETAFVMYAGPLVMTSEAIGVRIGVGPLATVI